MPQSVQLQHRETQRGILCQTMTPLIIS